MSNAAVTSGRVSDRYETEAAEVIEAIGRRAGALPQIELAYEADSRLLWITMRPEPKPVLTVTLIESLRRVQLAAYEVWGHAPDRPILFMALRSFGRIFSLGGDLDFFLDCLAQNDRAALEHYARTACEAIALSRNGVNGTVLTFSAIQARVMGGGIDTARGCNMVVAEEGATFSYPEVNYNHYPIAGVPVLSRHTGFSDAAKILLSGREYSASEFKQLGVLDAVVPSGGADEWIRRYAKDAVASQAARVGVIAACTGWPGISRANSWAAWDPGSPTSSSSSRSRSRGCNGSRPRRKGCWGACCGVVPRFRSRDRRQPPGRGRPPKRPRRIGFRPVGKTFP